MTHADPPALATLVAALPERYQPVFGHPEWSDGASRPCEDRLAHLARIYRSLEAHLGRPLRVLDLGCAQGFFSFSLASLGATVEGVDWLGANLDLCAALAEQNPGLDLHFRFELIEDVIEGLEPDSFDLVLGLSVFHHLVQRHGPARGRALAAILARRTCAAVFELAQQGESPDWVRTQPAAPRQLLDDYAFVHEVGESPSHISDLHRPLYFASDRCWYLEGRTGAFDAWQLSSAPVLEGAGGRGTRGLYFGGGLVVKVYTLEDPDWSAVNGREHDNEVAFLSLEPPPFPAPRLVLHGRHAREAWLVREQVPGAALIDLIRDRQAYDPHAILAQVLDQLAALEAAGLHHCDLRTWNLIVDAAGRATLIDYGSIDRGARDCAWPHNLFLALMIFFHEVLTGEQDEPGWPLRPAALDPSAFPAPYDQVFWTLFRVPPAHWRFDLVRDLLAQARASGPSGPAADGAGPALEAMAEAVSTYRTLCAFWRRRAQP